MSYSLLPCSGRLVSKTQLNSGGGVKNRGRLGSGRVIKLNSTGPKPLWFFVLTLYYHPVYYFAPFY